MARFVLISIPDNAEADNFVEALKEGRAIFGVPHQHDNEVIEINYGPIEDIKVEAVWANPTLMCECHPPWQLPNSLPKGSHGLSCTPAKSAKYGWLVCPLCSKPHPHQFQHPKNLLDPDEPRTYYLGFRADRKPKGDQ